MKYCWLGLIVGFSVLGIVPASLAQGRLERPSFFNDGQLLMDREIQRLQQQQNSGGQPSTPQLTVSPPPGAVIIDDRLKWQKYIFRDGGFSIWMPQALLQSQETIDLDVGGERVSFSLFASQPLSYRFVAAYSQPLSAAATGDLGGLLSSVQDAIVARSNFTLVDTVPGTWQQYPARQFTVRGQDEIITFKAYLIDKRLYVLALGQKKATDISQDAAVFFDYFQLIQ